MAVCTSSYFPIFVFFSINIISVTCVSFENFDYRRFYFSEKPNEYYRSNERDIPVHPVEAQGWHTKPTPRLGQVVGVAVNPRFQPVIFHRGSRVWDETTFNDSHHFQHIHEGPIPENTVLILDQNTGEILSEWGGDFFYLPHGLTIDNYGYYYMTDVALHQVFKFQPGSKTPSLVFGKKFEPGSGLHHLCKPTDVAVATTGEIFISDGYCNSRILKYDSNGNLLNVIPQNEELLPLAIPHSITLLQDLDLVCIADRENNRVVCPEAGLARKLSEYSPILKIQEPKMGRIFAVTSYGNKIFAVNGPSFPTVQVRGLTIDPMTKTITDQWTPINGFQHPHDVEVCHNTSSIYVAETTPPRIWKFTLKKLY